MAPEKTPFHYDSNWTFMYVVLGLIPVAFIAAAVYSNCQHKTTERGNDIEMAVRAQPPQRPRFPWREEIATSERPQDSNPYEAQAASKLPISPSQFGHRTGIASRDQETNENTRGSGENPTHDVAVPGPYGYNESRNGRIHPQDFEFVPL
ncbi:hypothetical protein F4818DRAFT_440388 [Hypoxylon cercidicola]|nr:hypothetical protein F4818DRAFT_440388 [Hypoxylon cercidicola]